MFNDNKKMLKPSPNWIVYDTDPKMHQLCEPVSLPLTSNDWENINKMVSYIESSYHKTYNDYKIQPGIGIAAPQIGCFKSMFYIHLYDDIDNKEYKCFLINPKILSIGARSAYLRYGEGCLSVKNSYEGFSRRKAWIKVEGYDPFINKKIIITAKNNLFCICLQHELDHLNGILFYDRIDKLNPFSIYENDLVLK